MLAPSLAMAEPVPFSPGADLASVHYELGGAAEGSARLPVSVFEDVTPKPVPMIFPERVPVSFLPGPRRPTELGDVVMFGGEDTEGGQDVLRLGTSLSRGRATTGVSVTYGQKDLPQRSEVFVDFAVTDALSVGVSGIMSESGGDLEDAVKRVGLSAAYTLSGGTFLQGGIANSADTDPVFGVSMGFRF